MKKTYNENMIFASGTFLTEQLPANFHEWEEEKLDSFLTTHAWEPFENFTATELHDQIETLAILVRQYND